MILTLFITFIAVALVLLVIGEYLSVPPLQIGAYVIGFLLGITLMLGGVTYSNGSLSTTNYFYQSDNVTLNNVSESNVLTYSNFSGEIVAGINLNHIFGLLISLLSVFGFISLFFSLKSGFGKGDNDDE